MYESAVRSDFTLLDFSWQFACWMVAQNFDSFGLDCATLCNGWEL